jgi:hypothetical protein
MNPVEDEVVESALDGSGFAWKRRESGWVIPASSQLAREIQITRVDEGVRVEAVLVAWDEIGSVEQQALAMFLDRAQRGLRFVRCQMDERQARVTAPVPAAELETGLAHAVGAVAAGVRLLTREAGTLLLPEAARVFLQFHGTEHERNPA